MAKTINRTELKDLLIASKGANFVNLVYFVDESKSKTVGGQKQVQKLVKTNVTIGSSYEKKVNRIKENKQGEEATFEALAPKGKMFFANNILTDIKTESKFYLNAIIENGTKRNTTYYHNGIKTTREEIIANDLVTPSFTKPKPTSGRGEVNRENDFSVITPNLDNIVALNMNKEKYVVIDFEESVSSEAEKQLD